MLNIWFLNVGHGDCTIIEHPSGRITMIDINNSQSYDPGSFADLLQEQTENNILSIITGSQPSILSALNKAATELTDPIAFFKAQFPNRSLFRFILTHPDMDHMRGLFKLFKNVSVENFWHIPNNKAISSFRSDDDRLDWALYQALTRGQIPDIFVKTYLRGDYNFAFNRNHDGTDGGDGIYILSPSPSLAFDCNRLEKFNDLSIVLGLHYAGRNVILPGDAESTAWDDIVATYGNNIKADVLKASHHGRDSGFHSDAISLIAPDFTIVSVGRKPATDAHSRYARSSGRVASTRRHGNIHLRIHPDGAMEWFVQRNAG